MNIPLSPGLWILEQHHLLLVLQPCVQFLCNRQPPMKERSSCALGSRHVHGSGVRVPSQQFKNLLTLGTGSGGWSACCRARTHGTCFLRMSVQMMVKRGAVATSVLPLRWSQISILSTVLQAILPQAHALLGRRTNILIQVCHWGSRLVIVGS